MLRGVAVDQRVSPSRKKKFSIKTSAEEIRCMISDDNSKIIFVKSS